FSPTQFGFCLLLPAFLIANLPLSSRVDEVSLNGSAAWASDPPASSASALAPVMRMRPMVWLMGYPPDDDIAAPGARADCGNVPEKNTTAGAIVQPQAWTETQG